MVDDKAYALGSLIWSKLNLAQAHPECVEGSLCQDWSEMQSPTRPVIGVTQKELAQERHPKFSGDACASSRGGADSPLMCYDTNML